MKETVEIAWWVNSRVLSQRTLAERAALASCTSAGPLKKRTMKNSGASDWVHSRVLEDRTRGVRSQSTPRVLDCAR